MYMAAIVYCILAEVIIGKFHIAEVLSLSAFK